MAKVGYARQLLKEFVLFARQNKVYWIIPLIMVLLVAALLIASSTAVSPFIYTIF